MAAPSGRVVACGCGKDSHVVRFGPYVVQHCLSCHRLKTTPIVDPRIPKFKEHVKALTEEIGVEQEENEGKKLVASVERAARHKEGAELRLQIMEGNARWVVKGSRLEGFVPGLDPDTSAVNVDVEQKAGTIIDVVVDDKSWAEFRAGSLVDLRPQTNATLYRNLLKAFLAAKRRFPEAFDELASPQTLPKLQDKPVPGLDTSHLRPSQAKALRMALNMPDHGVLLIQGPPGTGKTTVIAHLIRELARRRQTVLVASHTHVAIDNALRKALKADIHLAATTVRLGDSGRISSDLVELSRRVGSYRADDPEDPEAKPLFAALQEQHGVVGMTLDALACALLQSDQNNEPLDAFDTVIIDEAGMNAFPKIAIAACLARKLILVGDPLQLPPIVRAWSFRNDENYKRSHFEILQMMRPDLCVMLDEQFRCHPRIYRWSNDAVYEGKVASRTAERPLITGSLLGQPLERPVVWVDTSGVAGNKSEAAGSSRINPTQAELAIKILETLGRKVPAGDLGYISPFRAQAQAVRQAMEDKAKKSPAWARVTASTVDAFQGNERRVIVFDLTTLHPAKPHEDHRRLNVSLTRAQELLIIIGPRPFVAKPKDNPFLWSLQNWEDVQVIRPE